MDKTALAATKEADETNKKQMRLTKADEAQIFLKLLIQLEVAISC